MTVINEGRFSGCGSLSPSPTEDSDSDRILQSAKPPNPLATACQFNRDASFILHPPTDTHKHTETNSHTYWAMKTHFLFSSLGFFFFLSIQNPLSKKTLSPIITWLNHTFSFIFFLSLIGKKTLVSLPFVTKNVIHFHMNKSDVVLLRYALMIFI